MQYGRMQEEEMAVALKQKRQPICIYCNHPLDEVREPQDELIVWRWVSVLKQYQKSEEGSADAPYHFCRECEDNCEAADWQFIDYKLISF
jgi:hypothetical protein